MTMRAMVQQRAAVTNTGLKKQPPVDSIQPHCDEVHDDDSGGGDGTDEVGDDDSGVGGDDDDDDGGGGDDGYSIHLRVQGSLTDLCAIQWSD